MYQLQTFAGWRKGVLVHTETANEWLRRQGDTIEVISISTTEDHHANGTLTILYRRR